MQKDPILFAGGDTNLYGYVLNDPVNFVDPTGTIVCLAPKIAALGALSVKLLIEKIILNSQVENSKQCDLDKNDNVIRRMNEIDAEMSKIDGPWKILNTAIGMCDSNNTNTLTQPAIHDW